MWSWLLMASLLSKSHGIGRRESILGVDSVPPSLHHWCGGIRWRSLLDSKNWSLLPIHSYKERARFCGGIKAAGHEPGEHSHGVPHSTASEFSSSSTAGTSGFEKGLKCPKPQKGTNFEEMSLLHPGCLAFCLPGATGVVTVQTRTGSSFFSFFLSGPFKVLTELLTWEAWGSHPCYSVGAAVLYLLC